MTSEWTNYPVPAVPEDMRDGFVAHSVVATCDPSLMSAPSLSWHDLKKYAMTTIVDEAKEASILSDEQNENFEKISAMCAATWKMGKGNTIVALAGGTMILVPNDCTRIPKFGGFTEKVRCADTIPHSMPPHRFKNTKVDAAEQMMRAQLWYDRYIAEYPDRKKCVDTAFSILNVIGYPNAGMSDADANVVALWYCAKSAETNLWAALVECECFDNLPVSVVVMFNLAVNKMPNTISWMKSIADIGRKEFREEFLYPRVVGYYPVMRE
jgi:hypothetical protein